MACAFGKTIFTILAAGALNLASVEGSIVWTFDFPGNPGSGLAVDQTNNSQPANASVSNFTRTVIGQTSGAGIFGSNNWSQSTSFDPTTYESFSITADIGYHLNLTSLAFDSRISPTGPANVEVALFLNGSSTAYATYGISPTGSMTTYTFNFTPLSDGDNVTSAVFKFYGWNAGGAGGQMYLDNVVTNGTISNVPETSTWVCGTIALAIAGRHLQRMRRQLRLHERRES